ncbi:hypothetical protein AVEN_78776-1 [Araneus ventricosus]|uniref:Uncharacterized protein n=1 Tax=Araneus ventricosus TaxID=182803 RepID=A0A4Y2M739_ARAVE|nr:hypothetical protein AVEN_78776-1 [Araneus ventricosus]
MSTDGLSFAASAALSATSLPATPMWALTQCKEMVPSNKLLMSSTKLFFGANFWRAFSELMLSVNRWQLACGLFCCFHKSACFMAVNSAWNTEQ